MTVTILKTGDKMTVNASYGLRLIEQGKAIFVPVAPKKRAKKEARRPTEEGGA